MTIQNSVRIIGGKWRSRKITFPSLQTLRPTPDRVRETVFNWLMGRLENAVCLDLFAGSGALGFEALSRGASHVTFVEHSRLVIDALRKNVERLGAEHVDIVLGQCPSQALALPHAPFDLVFLDPPFHQNLISAASEWLELHAVLKKNAWIYVECEQSLTPIPVPSHWKCQREQETATLRYALYRRA